MAPPGSKPADGSRSEQHSAAQTRIINAALDLFAEHGVGGTSLQMIADSIGVTKAAVYHQFPTKDEIVLAAAGAELANLAALVDVAEAEPDPVKAREVVVTGIVELAVERRRMESSLLGDPVIVRYFSRHEPFLRVMDRLYRLLMGDQAGKEGRVPAAMLTAAIGGAVMHPLAADLDDDTLRAELLRLATRFLDPLPPTRTTHRQPGGT
jgi:AcrR family transcriptional regulator